MGGEKLGGIVDLALILYHTNVELTVIHAESIYAKASDKQVQVAIHPAMLESLPKGPTQKTKRVFVILERNHYYFAVIRQGDNMKAIFDIGQEADEAQNLTIALLKSQNHGPLATLSDADRKKKIAQALDQPKALSWAEVAKPKTEKTNPVAPSTTYGRILVLRVQARLLAGTSKRMDSAATEPTASTCMTTPGSEKSTEATTEAR
jgi:hypothetical protein